MKKSLPVLAVVACPSESKVTVMPDIKAPSPVAQKAAPATPEAPLNPKTHFTPNLPGEWCLSPTRIISPEFRRKSKKFLFAPDKPPEDPEDGYWSGGAGYEESQYGDTGPTPPARNA